MSGIKSSTFKGNKKPRGVLNPTRKAIKVPGASPTASTNATATATETGAIPSSTADLVYSRRYLDWNRLTFAYHAVGSQDRTFDLNSGRRVSKKITQARKDLNLTALYGCVPRTYCQYCQPYRSEGNIFTLLETALAVTVVNESRADIPRIIIINSGNIRFDLVQGPFT